MRCKLFSVLALGIFLAAMFPMPSSAGLFEDLGLKGAAKSKEAKAADVASRKFKFTVHLTTGDVLKAIEYGGGSSSKKGVFRFVSNFESDIAVKLPFVRYVDMDMIGEESLSAEYATSRADRIYLKNKDFVTGKIEAFTNHDIRVATTYGDLKIDVTQVRYIIFRNPAAGGAQMESPKPAPSPAKPAKSDEGP